MTGVLYRVDWALTGVVQIRELDLGILSDIQKFIRYLNNSKSI